MKPALASIKNEQSGPFRVNSIMIALLSLLACLVLAFQAEGAVPPTITQPPQSLAVAAGEDATFTVTVTNTATMPINYQWRKGSTPLTNILLNATTCSFTLYNVQTNVTATNGPGSYRVAISNAATPVALAGSRLVSLSVVPASAPSAITGIAGDVAGDGATLYGVVNPNGSTTWARYEYGLTSDYGNSTPSVKVGNWTNFIPVSVPTPGLMSGTTYHYRLVATNFGGMAIGADQTLMTLSTPVPPPVAITLPVGNLGLTSALLNGSVDANQGYAGAYFEYGQTTNYGLTTPVDVPHDVDAVSVSANVAGLSAKTTYHYRLVAFNFAGTNFGADESFETLAPPEVLTLPITRLTVSEAVVRGRVNPNGFPTVAHFEYGLSLNYGNSTTPIDVGTGNAAILVSNMVTGLLGYTNYHFRLVATNPLGTVFGADETFALPVAQQFDFKTLAGGTGGSGWIDGTGSVARFSGPAGVAVDSAGNVYVAEIGNYTVRKIAPGGAVSTLAGLAGSQGCLDGTGSEARFHFPLGVAVDSSGNLYVADTFSYTIRKITPGGVVSTLAGLAGSTGSYDGIGSIARFKEPFGVAVDSGGNVYVADWSAGTIRKITPGGVVSTLAGVAGSYGTNDGPASVARLHAPYGVAVDGAGNVYFTESYYSTLRKITPGGVVSTLAGSAGNRGTNDGAGANARFWGPNGVAVDKFGYIYVADRDFSIIRKVTPAGVVSTLAGWAGHSGTNDGTGLSAQFNSPDGVAVDSNGNVYVGDRGNSTIRQITPDGVVSTLAGLPYTGPGSTDGSGRAARFAGPQGVAVDGAGYAYVADSGNHTIRKITPEGLVSTLAGLVGSAGTNDGAGDIARFNYPNGVTVDGAGILYVSDTYNNTIRTITPDGFVSTLAGLAGTSGTDDGLGSVARFNSPYGVAVDNATNVYVADGGNHTVRKITPSGLVSTLAGLGGLSGRANGTGSVARFFQPRGVAADNAGNVYVADSINSAIRKITPAGMVSTLAGLLGSNEGPKDGTGSSARFNYPSGVAVDNAGNVYVAENSPGTLRAITPGGVVSTIGGLAFKYGNRDGTGSVARFSAPWGMAVDEAGNVYVADTGNNTIRRGTPKYITITEQPADLTIFEGGTAALSVEASSMLPLSYQWRFNGADLAGATNATLILNNTMATEAGEYRVVISSAAGSVTSSVAKLTVIGGAPSLSIDLQPQSQTVNAGATVTLSVSATGNPPPSYQWRRNGVNIPGAVSPTLTLRGAQLTDGGRFSVVVGSLAGIVTSDPADVVITSPALPFADNFTNRVIANSLSGKGSGSNSNATHELGEPNHAGLAGGKSVWYAWQAPANGVATFSTLGSGFDTLLGIYTGSSLTNLAEVASDDDRGGFLTSRAVFQAIVGTVYNIAMDGFAGASGKIALTWNLDTTVSDLPLITTQPLSQTVTNGATASLSAQATSPTGIIYSWYHNCEEILLVDNPTATSATLIVTNVQPAQVGTYTVRVYNGFYRDVESLPAFLEIGPQFDGRSRDKLEDLFASPGSAIAAPPLAAKGGPRAGSAAPSAFVSVAAGTLSSQVLNNFGAATQQGESNHCGVIGGSSKWFGLQPTNDGVLLIDTIGSAIDTVLAVYTGTNLFSLSLVACDNNSAPDKVRSRLRLNAQRGTRYSVAIDGANAAQGIINLNWGLGTAPVLAAQPVTNLAMHLGDNLTLNVSVSSAIPAADYQWRLNGRNITGATNSTLSLNNMQSSQAGDYSVVVGNFVGAVTSTVANATVALPIEVRYEFTRNNGQFQFRLLGPASEGMVVETSSDLRNWSPLYTNTAAGLPLNFLDAAAADSPRRFYRVMPWR